MLQRVEYMLREQKTFALETTLASKSIKNIIHTAHNNGYHAGLLFFYLESVELAKLRVQQRVLAGGHNIEEHVIHRRYHSGIRNLFDIYMPLCNTILIVNNSLLKPRLIACKENGSMRICNEEDFHKIKQYYEQQCQP